MEISTFVRAASLDEAYTLIHEQKGFPIGGGAWSRLNARRVDLAVDLSALGLRFIRKNGNTIEIGAMTTARDIETSRELQAAFGRLFSDTVAHIVGVQMKNIVTVGGTVAGRYGFSDLNTTLLAAGAQVVLFKEGTVDFADFLSSRSNGPILIEKILIPADGRSGAFTTVRTTVNDFPILNAAAVHSDTGWRIAVGARPGAACPAVGAARILGADKSPDTALIGKAAEQASAELSFGSDVRGSGEYRTAVCSTLVKRAVQEAAQ
ncbi:MAG: FAD binding domain-containing protein [Sediminispirochaetaceae bacterium]